ncbi:chemotaxis protein CheW [Clostridium estertheticum]|uniref:chemotaxis protein CheW n=1 Tax=Clostridium estertheticum TaxID=238834 RepID=UPI001CF3A1F4|nr:chemotaxis protein CheW [Clostridium estertheticum]MCB2361070.1 chemotaxis protein CheW [Clostridium estertheticum]
MRTAIVPRYKEPSFIEGVINIRGKIIPVLNLKKRFGIDQSDRGIDSRLLIIELDDMMG